MDIRLPNITAQTEQDRMAQMQDYMYQLVAQLNWAFSAIEKASEGNSQDVVVKGSNGANTSQSPQATFDSIKSLIIKSADIVNAYYDTMKKSYDGVYAAQSDFGEFKQVTKQQIEENSTGITSVYNDVQLITSDIEGIQNTLSETSAWTKTGLLDMNGEVPVYGFEVGQKTMVDGQESYEKYARFTPSGIYFYIPGVDQSVAWMDGTKLYITNADIVGSMKVGKYSIDTANGLAFKWVGG